MANLLFGARSRALELFMQSSVSYQKLLHLWLHLSLIQSVFTRHSAHTLEIKVYRRNIRAFRYLKPLTSTSIFLPKRSSSFPMRIASNVPASFSSLYAKVCLHREHPSAWLWMLQVLVKFKVPHILFCSDPILTSLQRKRNGQITLHAWCPISSIKMPSVDRSRETLPQYPWFAGSIREADPVSPILRRWAMIHVVSKEPLWNGWEMKHFVKNLIQHC